MLSTQPQFTFWNPNNSNVQPPLSPIQRPTPTTTTAIDNNNHLKQQIKQTNDEQRPPSTPIQHQQQLSKDSTTPRSPDSSSFHEDDTSLLSSPNSSLQASSPKQQQQHHHLNNSSTTNHTTSKDHQSTDIFQKLLELGNESDRKQFVERLQSVWEEHSIQCRNLPNLSKQTLDLYKLYSLVRDRGGFNETTRLKQWKEISSTLNISNTANSAFIVKRKFVQFGIFHYECKYDLNGVDPIPLIIEMEKNSKKFTNSKSSNKTKTKKDNLNGSLTPTTPSSSSTLSSNVNNNNNNNKPSLAQQQHLINQHYPQNFYQNPSQQQQYPPQPPTTPQQLINKQPQMNYQYPQQQQQPSYPPTQQQMYQQRPPPPPPSQYQQQQQQQDLYNQQQYRYVAQQQQQQPPPPNITIQQKPPPSSNSPGLLPSTTTLNNFNGLKPSILQQQQQHSQIQALLQQPTLQMPPTTNNHQRPTSSENQYKPSAPLAAMSNITQQLNHPPPATPPSSIQMQRYQQQQQNLKPHEIIVKPPLLFPFESIESTQVNEVKKRKISSKDITPCDPWKLYLSLKSGLLSESTWALDALNILLFDDNTIPYFHLKHFPGLIKILLEHYIKCLNELFKEDFDDGFNFDENVDHYGGGEILGNKKQQENEYSEENGGEGEDQHKVFKLVFNEKEMSKFCSYNKTCSLSKSDSRSSQQLVNYSRKILDSLNRRKRRRRDKTDDSSYLKTHLNTDDELIKTEKLFFGKNKTFEQKWNNKKREGGGEEDEQAVVEEECLFKILSQKEEELMQRCMCISTIIRNLTFVPGNDVELCKNTAFIKIIGILLKFKHKHNLKIVNNEEEEHDCESKIELNNEWWWECVHLIRENTLVTISNISGAINLNNYDEMIIKLFIDGLIHWSICKSSDAVDVLITLPDTSTITAQRLAIESLSKMTIFDVNIDLMMATISPVGLDNLFSILSEWLIRRDEQTLREFSIVLLTSIAKCDQLSTKLIAKYFSLIVTFLEDFEEQARILLSQHHHHHHNPYYYYNSFDNGIFNEDNLGTTNDMLLRCANCLVYLSLVADNISIISKYQERLLDLSTSQCIDYHVSKRIAEVLYNINNNNNKNNRLFMPYT